jgi:V/A-type H+-transporting ATPase subunit I
VSLLLMFGMMFGDVGHGLVIAGAALAFRRKLGRFTVPLVGAGAVSTIFGLLYGSIFGYEHVIPALWLSPLEQPIQVLKVAVIWGIGFLLTTNLLRIVNWLQQGRWADILFHNQGIAGILFYLAGLWGIQSWLGGEGFGALQLFLIVAPLAVILGYHWLESEERGVIRILVALIEGIDTLIAYLANTLSFLRVAAFSINHVALAFAVFVIAGMLDSVGHLVTVILGNVFILVLEGAIVAIQCLRLEYYEGFSRFFGGGGQPFRPLGFSLQTTSTRS